MNEITPWIDGGLMYGIGKTWADALRNFTGGRMASTRDNPETYEKYNGKDFPAVNDIRLPMANPPPPRDHYLKNVNRFFRKFIQLPSSGIFLHYYIVGMN